jgi:predicted permease
MVLSRYIRSGSRPWLNSPGFFTIAVLLLALAIGPTTVIFSLADAILFKMLPVPKPQDLILLKWDTTRVPPGMLHTGYDATLDQTLSFPMFQRLHAEKQIFSTVFGFAPLGFTRENVIVNIDGYSDTANGVMVSGEYFSGLGITPFLGRTITESDETANGSRVAVISYAFWQQNFGGDRSVVGHNFVLNTTPYEIVGVAAPGFSGLEPTDTIQIWIPIQESELTPWNAKLAPGESMLTNPKWWWLTAMGRLRPGVEKSEAQSRINYIFQSSILDDFKPKLDLHSLPDLELTAGAHGTDKLRRQFSKPIVALIGLSFLLLLIACFNLSMLLLGRGIARRKEMSIRVALGAMRKQLMSEMLMEYGTISCCGTALGMALAFLLGRMPIFGTTLQIPMELNLRILGFTVFVGVLTLAVFAIIPILWTTNINISSALSEKSDRASFGAGKRSHRFLSRVLIISEIAISTVLLMAAGVFSRTLTNLVHQELGFKPQGVWLFRIDATKINYKGLELVSLYRRIQQRLEVLSSVRSVSFSGISLIANNRNAGPISFLSYPLTSEQDRIVQWNDVGPYFFETMGIRILAGRGIERQDTTESPKVAVINSSLARYYFGDSDPIGRRFSLNRPANIDGSYEVVGVVQDAKYATLKGQTPRIVYIPFEQKPYPPGGVVFAFRCKEPERCSVSDIRSAVASVEPRLPLSDVRTQDQQIAEAALQERLLAYLAGWFGLLALFFSTTGLFGILSNYVSQYSHEIAVRIALGAQLRHITHLVMRETVILVGCGIIIGVPSSIAITKIGASLLYGVAPGEPLIAFYTIILTGVVAILAAAWPVLRAVKVDANSSLRTG